jgi:hypothetical protein
MVKKADTVAKRWAEVVNSGWSAKLSAGLQELTEKFGPDAFAVIPDWNEDLPKWVDPTIAIFRLNPSSPLDQAVRTAFDKAGLDPKHPVHWKLLVNMFAWAHFGERPARGRPKEWTGEKLAELMHDFSRIRYEKPTIAEIAVCRLLKKRHPAKYGSETGEPSPGRLTKEVKRAFDPKFNPWLAAVVTIAIESFKAAQLKKGLVWNPEVEAENKKRFLKVFVERGRLRRSVKD